MRSWLILLSGLLIWAVHFFALYLIGEFAGDARLSRATILAASLLCMGIAIWLLIRFRRGVDDGFDKWRWQTAQAGLMLGLLSVLLQSLPALIAH